METFTREGEKQPQLVCYQKNLQPHLSKQRTLATLNQKATGSCVANKILCIQRISVATNQKVGDSVFKLLSSFNFVNNIRVLCIRPSDLRKGIVTPQSLKTCFAMKGLLNLVRYTVSQLWLNTAAVLEVLPPQYQGQATRLEFSKLILGQMQKSCKLSKQSPHMELLRCKFSHVWT